jgi:tetratricopeptide (TPR) repeat protein
LNATDYTYLLNHPESVNEKRTEELDKIVSEFPYFQSARALRLKGLYNEDSFRYNYALKVAAAFTADRSVLFDFITSDAFVSVNREQFAKKQEELHDIEVSGIEVRQTAEPQELTVDESYRASLDAEFVPADEAAREKQQPVLEEDASADEIAEADIAEVSSEEAILEDDAPNDDASTEISNQNQDFEIPATAYETDEDEEEISEDLTEETSEEEMPQEEISDEGIADETQQDEVAYDPATKSVMDSIKEAEQYAKSLVVSGVEEVSNEAEAESEAVGEITSEQKAEAETESPIGQKLEIGKPLDFSQSETHSFSEWLQLSQLQPIVREAVVPDIPKTAEIPAKDDDSETDFDRQKKNELIDKFIETNPKIPKATPDSRPAPFIFEPSQPDNSYLMTETLARVYLEQKKYDKAIQAYEILILKYPEKNSFFADRILDIKSLQQNNKF